MENFNIKLKHTLNSLEELSLIYTPGVGFASKEIFKNELISNCLTNRKNFVAVICDCEDCAESYLPFAQAISSVIKKVTGLDACPLVNNNYDINKIIENLTPSFAGFYIVSDALITNKTETVITQRPDEFDTDIIIRNAKLLAAKMHTIKEAKPKYDDSIFRTDALKLRENLKGVIETEDLYQNCSVKELKKIFSKEKLTLVSDKIKRKPELSRELTVRKNTIAIISDGSAVLGLGNIGAFAAMPVMEGKAAIFKELGGVNAIPVCLKTQNIQEIIDISVALSRSFGGINLEDINAPRCFEIEEKLAEKTDIPVFHDDQHGTAVIVLAALTGALKLAEKNISDVKIVMSGAGAAAQAVAKLLIKAGAKNLIMCDINGVISKKSTHKDIYLRKMAEITNPDCEEGILADILNGADVLIGLSAANIVTKDMIKTMNDKAIVFVLANPVPEIMPELAKEAGAFIVATGRSDFENQINNSLAFPGIFKGLLKKKTNKITNNLKYNAALAIARYADKNLSVHTILPKALDRGIVEEIVKTM